MLATWESVQVDPLSKSKTHRGQRIRVVFLLALFLLPLLSIWPLSEASAEASLPACCRTHGKYHCSAIRSGISISNDENAPIARTQILERCPFQGATLASHLTDLFDSVLIPPGSPYPLKKHLNLSRRSSTVFFRTVRTHPKRGPWLLHFCFIGGLQYRNVQHGWILTEFRNSFLTAEQSKHRLLPPG